MGESPLLDTARHWVVTHYPYNRDHLLRTLDWIARLNGGASEAVQLAALTHDMERAFPGPDTPVARTLDDLDYERIHSARSARIVSAWLREQQADEGLIADVDRLVRAHETGGWPDADLVQAADSLSFLEMNVDLFLGFVTTGRYSSDEVRRKFQRSYDRIRIPAAKDLARPLLDRALARLDAQTMTPTGARADGPAD